MKVGDAVGHFRVIARLGKGGMGEVWLAEHPVVRKRVAVKAIPADRAVKEVARDRFLTEARAVAALAHPHIVALHDFGSTGEGDLYFTMEHLEGVTLARRLEEAKKLPVARAVAIAGQIADALAAAHAGGVIHRDLKPDNIYLIPGPGGADFVKVLDFGLAKRMDLSVSMTGEGQAIGTPEYMAPEQVTGKRDLDGRVDVYALGCLLYEMIAGEPPFRGDTTFVMRAHRDTDPDLAKLPPAIAPIVGRAMAKDRDQRYPTVAELAHALTDVPPSGLVDSSAAPTREVRALPKTRLWIALAAAGAVVVAGVTTIALTRRPRPAPPPAAALSTEKPRPVLSVESTPAGAEVTVDDIAFGQTPIGVKLDPERSAVIVELHLAGYQTVRRVIDPSVTHELSLALTPAAPPPPQKAGARPHGKLPPTSAKRPFDDTGILSPQF
jgi:tRNA A-37 threonylcarbamoyl transferase component Bud32